MSTERRELQGWDEIAAYLGVKRRAAQNYEKGSGLPIRRLPGDRGRVWAYAHELDRWKELEAGASSTPLADGDSSEPGPPETPPERPTAGPRRHALVHLAWGLAVAIVCSAGFVIWKTHTRSSLPQDFRLELQELVALGSRGNDLWRFHFPDPLLRSRYPDKLTSRYVWTGNLDHDREAETLFAYNPDNWDSVGSTLYCFSQAGALKWQFKPGRRVVDAAGLSYETFGTGPFLPFKQSDLHRARVFISNAHTKSYPGQLAILSEEGRLVGEYWHSGHLLRIALADLDGDGVEDVIAGGVNNGYGRATLLVFDPRRMGGASRQPDGDQTQLKGFAPGAEKVLVWFPRSCITELDEPFNRVNMLSVTKSFVEVHVSEAHQEDGPYLIYTFDHHLKPLRMTVSDRFLKRHRELELSGRLRHSFSEAESAALLRKVEVIRK